MCSSWSYQWQCIFSLLCRPPKTRSQPWRRRWPLAGRRCRRWVEGESSTGSRQHVCDSSTGSQESKVSVNHACLASTQPCTLQVKAQYDSLLEEMAAASRKRERWQEQQAAAERELSAEREQFDAFTRKQVGSGRAAWRFAGGKRGGHDTTQQCRLPNSTAVLTHPVSFFPLVCSVSS